MPRHYWDAPIGENTLFSVRRSRYNRSAVCFFCRTQQRMEPAWDNDHDIFREHWDATRYPLDYGRVDGQPTRQQFPGVGGMAIGNRRQFGPNQEYEICPGSGEPPIPLAYKFPDGSPTPRY